jgi:hypothetical protein
MIFENVVLFAVAALSLVAFIGVFKAWPRMMVYAIPGGGYHKANKRMSGFRR